MILWEAVLGFRASRVELLGALVTFERTVLWEFVEEWLHVDGTGDVSGVYHVVESALYDLAEGDFLVLTQRISPQLLR